MDSDNNMETVIKDAKDGDNIVSSVDMNIQRIVQKSIKKYMKKYSPKRISVVIANPNNGEKMCIRDSSCTTCCFCNTSFKNFNIREN